MYEFLLKAHSGLRHLVLLGLVVVVVKSLIGMFNKQPYSSLDNKLGLFTFIFTHTQLLLGLLLYFVSTNVQFSEHTMKNDTFRYWTLEHSVGMLAAVVLITLARTTSKRMTNDADKHKRMFIFNFVALVVIIAVIAISGRKIL